MRVTLSTTAYNKPGGDPIPPGTEIDVPNDEGKGLIKAGIATAVKAAKAAPEKGGSGQSQGGQSGT
jgi:hypothetical protein